MGPQFGIGLAQKIDFDRRVDCDQIGDRCQNCAVMCVARGTELEGRTADGVIKPLRSDRDASRDRIIGRSEEHTSELQSLMRISYDVFCLKQKKTQQYTTKQYQQHNILNHS